MIATAASKIAAVLAKYAPRALDPPVLQPAGLYLELAGEDIRKRAFMIDGSEGQELCLRPDMTVPACRAALDLDAWNAPFAVRYEGLVFRRQTDPHAGAAEFVQAGAEWFAPAPQAGAGEATIIAAALETCRAAGAEPFLRLGDVGVFAALARSAGLPPAWSDRLARAFSRAGGPAAVLEEAAAPAPAPSALAEAMAALAPERAGAALREVLAVAGVEAVGGRSVSDIVERLRAQGAHAGEPRPSVQSLTLVRAALAIEAPPEAAFKKLAALVRDASPLADAIDAARRRWDETCALTKPPAQARFSVGLGRGISYYDGFVFELEAPALGLRASLGGGGRYDGLIQALAAREDKSAAQGWGAAGFAVRPRRLEDAAR